MGREIRTIGWILHHLCQFLHKDLCIFPAQARVRDRLAEDAFVGFLRSFLQIAFDHQPAHDVAEERGMLPATHHLEANARLFREYFVGIVVVGIHDQRGIAQLVRDIARRCF